MVVVLRDDEVMNESRMIEVDFRSHTRIFAEGKPSLICVNMLMLLRCSI